MKNNYDCNVIFIAGKSTKELNLAEAAMIAGLFQAPGRYDPYKYPEATETRRQTVLKLMKRHGYINQTEYTNTINTSETVIDTNQVENTSTIKNEEALPTGPATILKDQKITGYESDCVYLLDFKSTNYDQAVKYSCNEDLINTLIEKSQESFLLARTSFRHLQRIHF